MGARGLARILTDRRGHRPPGTGAGNVARVITQCHPTSQSSAESS